MCDAACHRGCPQITYCKVAPGKNCGFVQYDNRASAEMALASLNGQTVAGTCRMRLSWGRSQPGAGARAAAMQPGVAQASAYVALAGRARTDNPVLAHDRCTHAPCIVQVRTSRLVCVPAAVRLHCWRASCLRCVVQRTDAGSRGVSLRRAGVRHSHARCLRPSCCGASGRTCCG